MQKSPATLVEALHDPACYDHPVNRVKLVETHISWVFLAGKYAYKLKKPVNFGFLDFSTLPKRRHFCHEEVRLNRRFAPQLYLGVVSIGGSPQAPRLGNTPALDYLVKMRCFPRQAELDLMLQQQRLKDHHIEQFADYIAKIQQIAAVANQQKAFGSPAAISAPMLENFTHLRPLRQDSRTAAQLIELESWSRTACDALRPLMELRKKQGHIRECHGDMHLANMIWLDEQPVLFDCIEFNENLRWIDVLNDVAFLLMDLDDRGTATLAWRFLNRYLQQTGDYQGLPLLNLYKLYRALVRAKVTCLRLSQTGQSAAEQKKESKLGQSYLDLAVSYTRDRQPTMLISHGFSGSGKSTFIHQLAPLYGAVSIHSDIERKRLHGLTATATSRSAITAGIYTEQAGQQTYRRLQKLAESILSAGFSVIVDATFLKRQQRDQMQQLAIRLKTPFVILDFALNEKELYRRVELRSKQKEQVSEADVAVLRNQLAQAQPLSAQEVAFTLEILPGSSVKIVADLIDTQGAEQNLPPDSCLPTCTTCGCKLPRVF